MPFLVLIFPRNQYMLPVHSFPPFGGANALLSQPLQCLGQGRVEVPPALATLAVVHQGAASPTPRAGQEADWRECVA